LNRLSTFGPVNDGGAFFFSGPDTQKRAAKRDGALKYAAVPFVPSGDKGRSNAARGLVSGQLKRAWRPVAVLEDA
jgi:hypothetical protein